MKCLCGRTIIWNGEQYECPLRKIKKEEPHSYTAYTKEGDIGIFNIRG